MISRFSFPTAILFGNGALKEVSAELEKRGVRRPLVVTDPGLVQTPAFQKLKSVAGAEWKFFSGVQPNPVGEDVEKAFAEYKAGQCDGVIGFGGGSALDVAKAIRLRVKRPDLPLEKFDYDLDWSGLAPFAAIPTTAGTGSEVGRSSVIILGGKKVVMFHPSLLAAFVILDPELTRDLPPKLTAATGADALTHCIESFTSPVFHPLCEGIALEGIHLIGKSFVRAVENGSDLEARGDMLLAATMGGIAFQKDLGATHSLAHPLSSLRGLHHGTANALCLAAVMELNAARKPGLYSRVGIALGLEKPTDSAVIAAVRDLLKRVGLGFGLRDCGVSETDLDALVAQAIEDGCHQTNPVPVTRKDLRDLYLKSF
jgi:4-hydroxybutyrate dehydrogenase